MSKQPDALRLADQLKERYGAMVPTSQAAAELRRLHAALAASEASDAESLRMYRAARDERDRLVAINAQMLEALQSVVQQIEPILDKYGFGYVGAIKSARSAIAAATKEQP